MVHPTATIAAFCLLVGTTIAQQSCVIDLAFTVDVSGSIRDTDVAGETPNWQRVTTFMVDVIQGLDVRPDGVRVAVVTFGNRGILEFNLNTYNSKAQVRQAANNTRYAGGNTNTTGGLKVTYESVFSNTTSGNRPNVPDVILLITDGRPTRDREFLQTEVDRIKNANIRIIGIGVTNQVNETLMLGLVTDRNTDYFNVSRFEDLNLLLSRILNQACRTLAPPSTTPTTTPITTTTVTQPAPPPGCASRADVYLLLDGSGSISANNFNIMKLFTSTLIQDLSIDDGRIRLGMALFSTNVLNQFGLVQFNNRVDMIAAVNSAAYPMGTTNTAEAIRYVRQTGFSNGDRGDVPNILVIFTDGNSNDRQATLREAFLAKAAGIHILTIGIGDWTNVYELQSVASYPYQKNYIAIPRFSGLNDALKNRLRNLLCDNVNECSSNPCQRGNCINGIDMYLCNCPSGWGGRNCERSCRVGNDVVFALDSSGSIGEANFRRQLDFVRDVVYGLNLNQARIGVLEYANNPEVQFQLNRFSNTMDILNALSMFYMAGTTNTAGAILEMRNRMFTPANGDRVNNNNVGVVITDGRSNNFAETWAEARQARDNNDIRMVAVGIGSNVNQLELESIASFPNGPNVIRANSFTSLSSITEQLLGAVCNDVNECNSNPCQNGECVDLLSGYRCACNVGFSGRNCERRCNYQYDIILVIDASGSIRNTRFRDVLELAVSIVSDFQVSAATAKFGALIFSDNPQVRFQLSSYTSKQDVITAIRASQYIGGRTNIASALETVQNQMFTSNNGDRSNVQNHVIIITDGASTLRVGQAVPTAITMRVAGVKISVIGVGMDANTLELRGMASEPLSRMLMMAPSMTDVMNNQNLRNNIVSGIVGSTCDSVNECNSNPCQNGASCINDLHRYICNCNPDWTGLNCNRRCTNQMDVTFVLDFSGSLDNVFNIVIAFAREVTLGLPVELNRARVAVVTYASDASVSFLLNAYNSKEEILNALSFSRNGGRTNTQSALSLLYTDVFVANRGDRNGVRNVAIVVTDGGSNVQRDQTINRANDARSNGIDIYVAAFGEAPDLGEVNGISSNPDSQYVIRINNANAVQSAANTLLNDLCQ